MSDKKKNQFYSALLLGILLVVYLLFFRKELPDNNPRNISSEKKTTRRIDHREADFRHKRIYYTKHAICRMNCRQIDESEVKEIITKGKINYSKSDLKDTPCPTYAVEGITHDEQQVRIVVGNCSSQASIITVIDLKNDLECDCK